MSSFRGWGTTPYHGTIVFPDFPAGIWALVGINLVQRDAQRRDVFEIQCVFKNKVGELEYRWVECGCLPYLLPGTKWLDGRLHGDALDDLPEKTFNLDIDASSCSDLDVFARLDEPYSWRSGSLTGSTPYVVPKELFKFAGVERSYYRLVGVRVGDDPFGLIIPAGVLAYFYFGGVSTRLAQAYFTGRLDQFYDRRESYFLPDGSGVYQIRPAADISDADCWVIARIIASKANSPERRAFFRFHSSLVRANVNREPLAPKALFPFEGPSQLTVLGKPINILDADGKIALRRFLVHRIITCSAKLPFERISVLRNKIAVTSTNDSVGLPRVKVKSAAPRNQLILTNQRRPDRTLAPLSVGMVSPAQRFLAIDESKMDRENRYEERDALGAVEFVPGESSGLASTLQGFDENSNVHPLKFETRTIERGESTKAVPERRTSTRSRGVDNFLRILETLQERGAVVEPIIVTDDPPWEIGVWMFSTYPDLPWMGAWHLLKDDPPREDGRLERLALAASIVLPTGEHGALYDIEPRRGEPTSSMMLAIPSDGRPLGRRFHRSVLEVVREIRDVWGEKIGNAKAAEKVQALRGAHGAEFRKIKHNLKKSDGYVDKIISFLTERPQEDARTESAAE